MSVIKIYDTTLRDGSQGEEVAFTLEDKIRIARRLDEIGLHYIEGGWPGSNPKDIDFFREIRKVPLQRAKIVAFGSTRRANLSAAEDPNLQSLLEAQCPAVTIFGKSWDLHVREALNISLEENLELIHDSVRYLKSQVDEVIYDAEHFFDGYKHDAKYAEQTLQVAAEAGADCIVLCDTNGGTMPHELPPIIRSVRDKISTPLGIHAHNDAEVAVANSIVAIHQGVTHVQGTINGYGERCGNANLCSIIPNIKLKLKLSCIGDEELTQLQSLSRFVSELANMKPWSHQPYVGKSAFAHKGGVHVSAVKKNPETYEHIRPELVGNCQRVLLSDLSGKSTILHKAEEFHVDMQGNHEAVAQLLQELKELENQGYQFEGAEGSFELRMKGALGRRRKFFDLYGFRVIVEKRAEGQETVSEATIMLKVDGQVEHTAAMGNGPVNALDHALRKALEKFYPRLQEMDLLDYKVRILDEHRGTAAKTRVLIESGDRQVKWGTVGVSSNIIDASWQALVDSVEYKLHRDELEGQAR